MGTRSVGQSTQPKPSPIIETLMQLPTHPGPLILIVEDEGIIRMGAVELFQDAGFKVLEAADADEALDLLLRHWAELSAMFTDITMQAARMDGLALAFKVSISWPAISLLIASGRQRRQDKLPPGARFLSKPYIGDHAVRHVREMMALGN